MNWFTKTFVKTTDAEMLKKKVAKLDDCCEHVQEDSSLLYVIHAENDSFGKETYGVCEACYDKGEEEEGKEIVFCQDCKGQFEKKDTIEWRWYDFYAAQGDEPVIICRSCRSKERHLNRVQKDQEDYDEEFGR